MGDRASIVIRDEWPDDLGAKEAVFLYTHWNGSVLPEVLRSALARGRGRWHDASYLARVVFNEMTQHDQMGDTGFGIGTRLHDNEYDLLVLYDGRVYVISEAVYDRHGLTNLEEFSSVSFDDYCAKETRTWDNLFVVPAAA